MDKQMEAKHSLLFSLLELVACTSVSILCNIPLFTTYPRSLGQSFSNIGAFGKDKVARYKLMEIIKQQPTIIHDFRKEIS